MSDNFWADAEIIHAYSREQAIADGVLVDVSKTAKEAGFKIPTAMTIAVWEDCVAWDSDEQAAYQDESGRLWDVVMMARLAASGTAGGDSRLRFSLVRIRADGTSTEPELVELILHIGPGDTPEPVLTIMTVDEGLSEQQNCRDQHLRCAHREAPGRGDAPGVSAAPARHQHAGVLMSGRRTTHASGGAMTNQSIAQNAALVEYAEWVVSLADYPARGTASMNTIIGNARLTVDSTEDQDQATITRLLDENTPMTQFAAFVIDLDTPYGDGAATRRVTTLTHLISRAQAALDGHAARPSHHPLCDSDVCHSDCPTDIWRRIGDHQRGRSVRS